MADATTTWGLGDYPSMAERLAPVSERVVADVGAGPDDAVLDLARGTGNAALAAAERGSRATGVDTGPALLAIAAESCTRATTTARRGRSPASASPARGWGSPRGRPGASCPRRGRCWATACESASGSLALSFASAPDAAGFLIRTAGHVGQEQARLEEAGRWDSLREDLEAFAAARNSGSGEAVELPLETS